MPRKQRDLPRHDAELWPSRLAGLRGIILIGSAQAPHHVRFRATQIKVNLPTTLIVKDQHSRIRLPPQQRPHGQRDFNGRAGCDLPAAMEGGAGR
jgi:hypothetical protein